MVSFLKRLKHYIGTHGWTYSPLVSMRDQARLGVATVDPDAYFQERHDERLWLVDAIRTHFGGRRFSFCSIGSGYGGEEYALQPYAERMTLIEPDERQHNFLRKRFPESVEVLRTFFQFCRPNGQFDVIYASALSYWMDRDPLEGINPELLAFLQSNLKPDGLGIFLIYGGSHSGIILDKVAYIESILHTAKRAGFNVILYGKYRPLSSFLILSEAPRNVRPFEVHLSEIYVRDGKRIGGTYATMTAYPYTLIILLYVMARTCRKLFGDAMASFAQVSRLRRRK